MPLRLIPQSSQSPGGFDNGRITERRPVLYERRGPNAVRIGPLFYWAWAVAENGGYIAEHPHQGFEIVTVVLEGVIEHRDTLGTWKSLDAGSIQVMQTNSGVSHSERLTEGVHTEVFQIWFEPNLRETLALPPTYVDYPASAFTWSSAGGNKMKAILGTGSPAPLRTDAHLHEVLLQPTGSIKFTKDNAHAVIVAVSGEGTITMSGETITLKKGDAAQVTMGESEQFQVRAGADAPFQYAQVVVPRRVEYGLYPEI